MQCTVSVQWCFYHHSTYTERSYRRKKNCITIVVQQWKVTPNFLKSLRKKTSITPLFCISKKFIYEVEHSYLAPSYLQIMMAGRKVRKKKNASLNKKILSVINETVSIEQQLHAASQTSNWPFYQNLRGASFKVWELVILTITQRC